MRSELERKGNPEALKKAAEKKKLYTEGKLWEAIKRMETSTSIRVKPGVMFTPSAVAREAEVGRDTVYRYPKVIEYIKERKIEWKARPGKRRITIIRNAQDKVHELLQIKKQLTIDKENLARENYRLQFENKELKEKLQRFQNERKELMDRLADGDKIVSIRKRGR